MAKTIRRFNSGELFHITAGRKTMTSGQYNYTEHCFKPNFTDLQGIGGAYQVVRFSSRADAERWIREKGVNYDADFRIGRNVGSNEFIKIPFDNFDTENGIWTNTRKLDRIANLAKLERECPEYFGHDNDNPVNELSSITTSDIVLPEENILYSILQNRSIAEFARCFTVKVVSNQPYQDNLSKYRFSGKASNVRSFLNSFNYYLRRNDLELLPDDIIDQATDPNQHASNPIRIYRGFNFNN